MADRNDTSRKTRKDLHPVWRLLAFAVAAGAFLGALFWKAMGW
ncbi:hypothetical protein [Stappia sp. MMSF_3263]|nr:hypothetical protein [Stappia sp. MMSF_3263]